MNPILQFFQNVITLNGSYNWAYVWKYLFAVDIMQGVIMTVVLAVLAQLIGSLIGLLLYFLRRSNNGVVRWLAERYIWLFRGTPLLVQVLFLNALLPYIGLSRPLASIKIFQALGFALPTPFDSFLAGLAALALNEGAYMAEIVRAGIDAIDVGQLEAAKSLGMTYGLAMRRVVLPQAMRVIIPPLGNEFNSMLKSTSLLSVISVYETLDIAQGHGATLFAPLELLTVASVWYIALTTVWGFIQSIIERRLNASTLDTIPNERSWAKRAFGIGRVFGGGPELPVPVPVDHR